MLLLVEEHGLSYEQHCMFICDKQKLRAMAYRHTAPLLSHWRVSLLLCVARWGACLYPPVLTNTTLQPSYCIEVSENSIAVYVVC